MTNDVDALAQRVTAAERAAVAEALNLTEDRRPEAHARAIALLRSLHASRADLRAHRVGITGPPGVGKSTLVSSLSRTLRSRGRTVGVVAVDPSSLRSGGALLGDRARIAPDPADHGLFVRSLATAGDLGGLARSAPMALAVLASAYDVAILETVGVGQSETDVRSVTDTVVFVVQPGSGDALQFLKAGIMEVPDVLVVNKADQRELALRATSDLTSALASLRAAGALAGEVPILATSARDGTGIDALVDALASHASALAGEPLARRRRDGAIALGLRAFVKRHGEAGLEARGGEEQVRARIAARLDEGAIVPQIVDES